MIDASDQSKDGMTTAASARDVLAVNGLEVVYNRAVRAVNGISISVQAGEIVALLGPNGAGKTTTLRAIGGFASHENARIAAGTVVFNGRDVTRLRPERRARLGIGIVPESGKIFERLSVGEHISAMSSWSDRQTVEQVLSMFPRLRERSAKLAGLLSGGERQMLAIAMTLSLRPSVLLIDELSLGLGPKVVDELLEKLLQIRASQQVAVLLVEQNVDKALEVADRCYMIAGGQIVTTAPAAELRGRPDVWSLLLGQDIGHHAQ